MQLTIPFLILSSLGLAAASTDREIQQEWFNFNLKYGKSFRTIEENNKRFRKFKTNMEKIAEHNRLFEQNLVSYEMAIGPFADKDLQEMEHFHMGLKISENERRKFLQKVPFRWPLPKMLRYPTSKDWRERGAITPVKNQMSCGSCWSFASTGALESHHFLKYNKSVNLSEQNLIDCVMENYGCDGGWMIPAFDYVHFNGGIDSEAVYPYRAATNQCRYRPQYVAATCNGYQIISPGDEQHMLEVVATKGPLAVAIEANDNFMNYKQGIYNDHNCGKAVNHAVLVVGYGTENGHDYWLVKNSWGPEWGENGYVRMARNHGNQCGIASFGVYPEV